MRSIPQAPSPATPSDVALDTAASDAQHERRVQEMGRRRRRQADDASALAEAQTTAETARRAACLKRWPDILTAIETLVAAYNAGARQPLLTVREHTEGGDPAVTVSSLGPAGHAITVTVTGDTLDVHAHQAAGVRGEMRHIDCSRSDIGTAAYLLQDWMDRL